MGTSACTFPNLSSVRLAIRRRVRDSIASIMGEREEWGDPRTILRSLREKGWLNNRPSGERKSLRTRGWAGFPDDPLPVPLAEESVRSLSSSAEVVNRFFLSGLRTAVEARSNISRAVDRAAGVQSGDWPYDRATEPNFAPNLSSEPGFEGLKKIFSSLGAGVKRGRVWTVGGSEFSAEGFGFSDAAGVGGVWYSWIRVEIP